MAARGTRPGAPNLRMASVDLPRAEAFGTDGDSRAAADVQRAADAASNPQIAFELALMAALGLEDRYDVVRMTLDVRAGSSTATVEFARPVSSRPELAGRAITHIQRFRLVPDGDGA